MSDQSPMYMRKILGSIATAFALRGEGDGSDLSRAIEIEEGLLSSAHDLDDILFRTANKAELEIERGDFVAALEVIFEEFPQRMGWEDGDPRTRGARYSENPWLVIPLLKSYTLVVEDEHRELAESFLAIICGLKPVKGAVEKNHIERLSFKDEHPSERVAYWFVRAAERWRPDSDLFKDTRDLCLRRLEEMMQVTMFRKDAAGVILACELLDLRHRGLTEINAQGFLETVRENSFDSTREWLAKYPPNEDDWLAPLKFNYR